MDSRQRLLSLVRSTAIADRTQPDSANEGRLAGMEYCRPSLAVRVANLSS